jgi:hypothetical protein
MTYLTARAFYRIVPAADPTQLAMPAEMLTHGYYHTTGIGPD